MGQDEKAKTPKESFCSGEKVGGKKVIVLPSALLTNKLVVDRYTQNSIQIHTQTKYYNKYTVILSYGSCIVHDIIPSHTLIYNFQPVCCSRKLNVWTADTKREKAFPFIPSAVEKGRKETRVPVSACNFL